MLQMSCGFFGESPISTGQEGPGRSLRWGERAEKGSRIQEKPLPTSLALFQLRKVPGGLWQSVAQERKRGAQRSPLGARVTAFLEGGSEPPPWNYGKLAMDMYVNQIQKPISHLGYGVSWALALRLAAGKRSQLVHACPWRGPTENEGGQTAS